MACKDPYMLHRQVGFWGLKVHLKRSTRSWDTLNPSFGLTLGFRV